MEREENIPMRFIVLSPFWTILLDFFAWFVIHMGISYSVTQFNPEVFDSKGWLFRERRWEKNGKIYETLFKVKFWKDWLPDAAPWFKGGFSKRKLVSLETDYLKRFIVETCRGETAHWIIFLCSPIFFFWNEAWVGGLMIGVGAGFNLPCLMAQRYNRFRCETLLKKSQYRFTWRRHEGKRFSDKGEQSQ
jgi:glycosyl-4,4'-diaponeurosporenoate acyltransferase